MLQPDVLAISETRLQINQSMKVDNYKWVGNNRKQTQQRALHGSGGVGLIINNSLTTKYDIQVLDNSHEDILWVLLDAIKEEDREDSLVVGVCHMPPFGSSRGGNPDAFFGSLIDCLHQYYSLGSVVICGDLNARCGYEVDLHEDYIGIIPSRQAILEIKNPSGDMLLQFLRDCKLCMVNGRSGKDNFTCVSPKGRSVLDF